MVELTLALAREMLACAGLSDVDPADALAVRQGDGLLAGDGAGAGRGPGRAAGAGAANGKRCGPTRAGYVTAVDALAIGLAAWRLGAGRARKEDPVSAAAGVVLHRRPGDKVRAGDVLYELRADDAARIPAALEAAQSRYGSGAPRRHPYRW